MKTHNSHFGIPFFVFFITLLGCKAVKEADKTPIKKQSPQELFAKMSDNQLSFDWMSAKMSTKAVISNERMEVGIKLRLRKDSAIWMSVSPALGIEIARVLITKDSIKYLNRLEKTYYQGPFDYFKTHTSIDLNFAILQSILIGSATGVLEKPEDNDYSLFKSAVQKGNYQLKKTQKKKDKKGKEGKFYADDFGNKIWLNPNTFKPIKSEIHAFKTNKKIISTYQNFVEINEQLMPHKASISMKGEKSITISFSYYKVDMNRPLNMPYTIPEKYIRNE